MEERARKPVVWVGSSLLDLAAFPRLVRRSMGYALHIAQLGGKHPDAKPLKGFGGAGVLEVVEDYDRATFRVVYTLRLRDRIYVLHAFQKKSKRGAATPKKEMDVIRTRLRDAYALHEAWVRSKEGE